MLTDKDLRDTEILLQNCKTVKQMFEVLDRKFDLEKVQPGAIVKPTFIKGILQAIKFVNPKLK